MFSFYSLQITDAAESNITPFNAFPRCDCLSETGTDRVGNESWEQEVTEQKIQETENQSVFCEKEKISSFKVFACELLHS